MLVLFLLSLFTLPSLKLTIQAFCEYGAPITSALQRSSGHRPGGPPLRAVISMTTE